MKKKNTKLTVIVLVAIVMSIVCSLPAFAVVVKHEKIVAADGSGDYLTIGAALSAISGATDSNRYLIKVKPGIYNESVIMKNYVDLEGSGSSNTAITSNITSTAGNADCRPTVATLKGANSSTIKNIRITNTSSTAGAAVLIDNVVTNLENVVVEAIGVGSNENDGVCINGSAASGISLDNVEVKAEGGSAASYGIGITNGASVSINRSHSIAASTSVYSFACSLSVRGIANASDSVFEASGARDVYTIYGTNGSTSLRGVIVIAINGQSSTYGIRSTVGQITGSEISATSSQGNIASISSSNLKIGSTLIGGGYSGLDKLVNCWDENFNPIPNQ